MNLIRQEGAAVALPTPGYQIRNTFIHIIEASPKPDWKDSLGFSCSCALRDLYLLQGPGTDVVDQRAVQSMPHGMLLDCSSPEVL